ncbi:hypothetical protein RCL1_002347 [Eukaryota sp. TZLM3-RCL]
MTLLYLDYQNESDLTDIMSFLENLLSEPYSRWTYRFFVAEFPQFCVLVRSPETNTLLGCIIGRIEQIATAQLGYIGMVAVDPKLRGQGIGHHLVSLVLQRFKDYGCKQVYLETESSNLASLKLYLNFGFVKDVLLQRYYLNGNDAYRMTLVFD